MEILNCDQRSDEWFRARLGSIGGSSIADVMSGGAGKTRKTLMYRLAGEILSGQNYVGHQNADISRGVEQEPEARSLYELVTGYSVQQVGLIKEDEYRHTSPDGLVDPDGMIEIKCTIPSIHIEYIINGVVPAAYRKQVQWGLAITGRQWCDFISYSPTVSVEPIWIIRAGRDEKLIGELREGAKKFIAEMMAIVWPFTRAQI